MIYDIISFLIETSAIDGAWKAPTEDQIKSMDNFMSKENLSFYDIKDIAKVFYPEAEIIPHRSGILNNGISFMAEDPPVNFHKWFIAVSPFDKYNASIGRLLWIWGMKKKGLRVHLPFLHHFYFDSIGATTQDAASKSPSLDSKN